jgi:hypothetical protein
MSRLLLSLLTQTSDAARLAPRAWERVLREAQTTMLTARLAHQAAEAGWYERIPPRPRRHFDAARRVCESQQHTLRWELDRVEHALSGLGAPIVLLKGAGYLAAGIAAARGRVFSDIDIMVPRDVLHAAEAALVAHGWVSRVGDYDRRYYEAWMHELPALQHVQRESVIDLHHTITPPTSRVPVDARKLFASAQPLAGTSFLVLAPADMVLHCAVHLLQEGDFTHGLRDLWDLDALLREFGRDAAFWDYLAARARDLDLGRPLFYTLEQARTLLSTPIPESFVTAMRRFRPLLPARRIMGSLLQAVLSPESPGNAATAQTLLYLRAHYMRMPLRLLIPHLARKSAMRLGSALSRRPAESIAVGGEEALG